MARRSRGSRTRRSRSTASVARSSGRSTRSTSTSRRASRVDPDKVLDSILDEAVTALGLDILGLSRDQYREMLKPVVEGILSMYSSRPSNDAIIGRMRTTAQNLYMMASAYLLEKMDKLTQEQLEFVVANGGPVAGKYAPKLYRIAVELGRTDLIPQIRYLWEMYGNPTPIPCPRCGFRALTPELRCMVCGYEAKEKEVKKVLDFEARLKEFAEEASVEEVREVIEKGFVVVGETVKAPSAPREPFDVELRLTREELSLLRKLVEERRRGSRGNVAGAASEAHKAV